MIARRVTIACLAALATLSWTSLGSAAPGADPLPLFGAGTAVVVRLDLTRLDAVGLSHRLLAAAALVERPEQVTQLLVNRVTILRSAGATELFLLFDVGDFPGPPVLAVSLGAGGKSDPIIKPLVETMASFQVGPTLAELVRGFVVVGRPRAVARIKENKPANRPDLTAALGSGSPEASLMIALSPGLALRRAVDESLPELPEGLGGGPVAPITQGMGGMALLGSADLSQARATIQARDPAAALALHRIIRLGLETAVRDLAASPPTQGIAPLVAQVRPEVAGDRITVELPPDTLVALLAVPIRQAREAFERTESVNNLKTMGLAMHNFHYMYETFPPAFRADVGQKPLLSWRVLILPFLDEQKLYEQFKLTEPWDSPTNKPLMALMPKVYASPSAPPALASEGKTTYLTPRGPDTMFPGAQGIGIKEITDGTSSTIMILEADAANAAIWTKPDDRDVEAIVAEVAGRAWRAAFGDGSVRCFRSGMRPELIRALMTRSGAEAIDYNEF